MKKMFFVSFYVAVWCLAAKPMESIDNYNVVLVHGAADKRSGLDCKNDNQIKEVFGADTTSTGYLTRIGGYGSAWFWEGDFHGGFVYQKASSGATGMVSELRDWLTENIFENNKRTVYLQRPFVNPAGSPFDNGDEIGKSGWHGDDKCSERRSLIEEAQEVRADGRGMLKNYRTNPKYYYEDSLLPPSRNIIIAHSMGGVASREYVQGDNYNEDVDKVITLDSPHEGTQALSMLVKRYDDFAGMLNNVVLGIPQALIWSIALAYVSGDPISNTVATGVAIIEASNTVQAISSSLLDIYLRTLFPYEMDDPLVRYIDPSNLIHSKNGNYTIEDLKKRNYDIRKQIPMFRLLYSTKSLTFTDPQHSLSSLTMRMIVPDGLATAVQNVYAQATNDNPIGFKTNAAFTSLYLGILFGLGLEDNGSSLIPSKSGSAAETTFLNNTDVDVKRVGYNGAFKSGQSEEMSVFSATFQASMAALAVANVVLKWNPGLEYSVKVSIIATTAFCLAPLVMATAYPFIDDIRQSHEAPALSKYQSNWKASPNTYSKILGGQESYEPYRMEEFLYEKPFANIRVISKYSNDWKDQNKDTLGLFGKDSSGKDFLLGVAADFIESKPLAFKSSSDWETFGAKKVRWGLTTGVKDEKIPIRHADRYPTPGFMVTDFIQKYEFEIDDLMPHRLRQIRLNFNFNEELAWECDINKAETDDKACEVYKRTPAGPDWIKIGNEKHPVKKNGIFVFEPKEYYKDVGLGAIQKDNQNTVILSMVNKVGLTNSQRFYYLFKATADLVEPFWPLRNIKVSKIDGFKAYASTLDYQGFAVLSGQERMTSFTENMGQSNFRDMRPPLRYGEGFLLEQGGLSNYSELSEGKYDWHVNVATGNGSDITKSEMFIPFILDKTPPEISLANERDVVNLDSVTFLARFKNENTTEFDESLRMVAFFLKKDYKTIVSTKFSNVLASNFGVSLSDFGKNAQELKDGEYEIVAYAFDGSVGSLEQYNLLNSVANGDSGTSVYSIIDSGTVQSGINFSKAGTKFFVDMQPPEIREFSLLRIPNGREISKPAYSLAENQSELILNQDSLLKIFIDISDSNGKNSAVARYSISFTDRNGGNSMQMGDTVMLSKGKGQKEWLEQGNMLIPDGDYDVSIKVWDEAGNASEAKYGKFLRIDRMPPSVVEVVSAKLTYADASDDYSAKIYVEQKDNESHLSEMECHWRINGGGWNKMGKKLLKKAELQISPFEMDKEIVGATHGKRHLEAGCMDWAGNFASMLDLFHVGELSPIIAYPADSIIIGESVMAIRGMAPKRSSDDSLASYKLEWRKSGEISWQTGGVDVGAGKRSSDSSPWLSNGIQPNLGDLGYLHLGDFDAGNYYELRLSVRDCSTCAWRSDIVSFYYWPQGDWGSGLDGLIFAASGGEDGFIPGEDTLSLSLSVTGSAGDDFHARFYAQDSKGNALFEISADTLSVSPYEGKPASLDGSGIWFWSENETYNLQWSGLPAGKEIAILYAGGDIDDGVCGTGCSSKDTLLNSSLDEMYKAVSVQHEMRVPKGLGKAMLFSGSSGSIRFKNKKAFWLAADTLPIHLGKGSGALETIVNFSRGFQVNPDLYGLRYKWDGIASTGRYPQGDSVAFYAEAVENRVGGKVLRDSLKVHIKKPDLRIASDSSALDDFYVVSYKGSNGANGENVALGKKSISYGIVGRDALVSAYIKNEKGDIVKTFFKDAPHIASRSDKVYQISWDGVSNSEHLVSEGNHYFYIVANEAYASEPQSASLSLNFKISYSPGVVQVKDEPGVDSKSTLSLVYANSVSSDYWRYTPVADYLVKAEASGKTLPDSLRNLTIDWAASGTQSVYGYSPQRFSLAVKRQRRELPLVILYKVKVQQSTMSVGSLCYWYDKHYTDSYRVIKKNFTTNSRLDSIAIEINRKSDYGFTREPAYLDVWAVLLKDYEPNYKYTENDAEIVIKKIEDNGFNYVWKATVDIPNPENPTTTSIRMNGRNYSYIVPGSGSNIDIAPESKEDKRCEPKDEIGAEPCSKDGLANKNYDPNKNLFELTVSPGTKGGAFRTNYGSIATSPCSNSAFRKISINLKLRIPDNYWDAGYGYDNLVNRTIRLDQTNKTIYDEEGYLKQIAVSKKSVKDSIFYDGEKWYSNYNYGMLTPFEVHRFPFVSVDNIPSNNAFAFPDETASRLYQYPSYYHAKFYNVGNNNSIQYRAVIKSQNYSNSLRSGGSITTPLLGHGNVDIYVSMDAQPGSQGLDSIPYPANSSDVKSNCPSISESWLSSAASEANCKKYYDGGSKIHYAVGDFTNAQWDLAMTTTIDGKSVIANINNSENPRSPFSKFGDQSGKSPCATSLKIDSSNYDKTSESFYAAISCASTPSEIKATYKPKIKGVTGSDTALFSFKNNILYITALNWKDSSFWRRLDTQADYPKHGFPQTLRIDNFFNDNWVKELKLTDAKLLHLNNSQHTHFKADFNDANKSITLSVKDSADSIRPSEFIAVKGKVPGSSDWRISYLNRGILHSLASGHAEDSLLAWFNVNKLQGNTSILLQWGSGGVITNMRKLDLDIGSSVTLKDGGVVKSLFGEVSVTFPKDAIADTVVTVRTADAKDYAFETLSGSALLGPVVEVLPSMTFKDTNALPRIKSRIMKNELNGISPDRVRLYKIDSENKKFVELQNTLIGFDVADSVVLECKPENYENCGGYSNNNWSYLLISAETRTFSAFAILDKDVAEQSNIESDIVPDKPLPTEIVCEIPEGSLWLGLDNGYLELPQWCNQPAMGMLQLRQGGSVIAEARQNTADTLRWDGRTGINKIAHGDYASRYIAIGATGQEMQTIGPVIYTDTLKPVISSWSVGESSVVLDREFKIQAKVHDDLSGINSIRLNWSLNEAISGTVYLNADKDGNVDYALYIPRNQLAQCVGCNLKISLRVEDKGHNWAEQEWQSDRLWPYPTNLALWYPALESAGKTANEYIGTGHDLDLLMPTPWVSASGIYFKSNTDKAPGKGQVNLGRTDSYTLEAWVRPGHAENSVWSRLLGFSFADGRHVDLQVKDRDIRLLDGAEVWTVPDLLSQPKAWSHLAIAVDGNHARFYMDGKLAGVAVSSSSERLWFGNFSLGTNADVPSFIGNLMQVRLYKRALAEEEIHAIFSGVGLGDGSRVEIALARELYWKADGVERGFSCAVPGSAYWGTSKENTLSFKTWVEQGASYKIFLYARSAQPGNKTVKAGVSGNLISGTVSLESVWRPVALQGIALPLRAGFNDIELRLPAGVDVAGIAISDNSGLLPSQISWKSGNSEPNYSAVATQVRFEGHPDPSMIRPRIRLQNISPSTIYGPKVRYYFRGEDPAQVQVSKFYPQEGELAVRQEGDNLGYAEWVFPETTALPSRQFLFWGEGPHFGLHNTNYVPWVTKDDPSFAEGNSNSFVDAPGIVVLDEDNRVLSGSCFENEEGLISTPVVQVLARDSRAGDNQASQLYIRLENIGQVPIRDYEVRYSFYVPSNVAPVLDVYDMQGLSASLKNLGSGRWQVVISGSASLGPGISWANPAQFALHLPNWQTGWNAGDDPSYKGISAEWALAKGIEVFDASGNRIYGKEPIWPVELASSNTPSTQVRVMAKQTKAHESNASAVRFYVENLGTESISGFEVRYWLSVAQGKQLGYQAYNNTQFSANVVNDGGNLYSGRFVHVGSPLAPGAKTEWGEGLEFLFYHSDWSLWDKESDFSHKGLGIDFSEAYYMAVYDSKGNLIWGAEPVTPSEANDPTIKITRLPDGLLVTLLENSELRLDLVNVAGIPQKFLYQGFLGAGESIIPVNWSNVDISKTYLVVRLNGKITTQLLSTLGN